jgi:hypothetical protein
MQTDTRTLFTEHRTGGTWTHAGRLTVRFQLPDGSVQVATLPDDLVALRGLQARVEALEAAQPPAT